MKMKAILKRATGLLVVIAMLLSMMPTVFADPALRFTDFPTGWSKAAMTAAVNNGLLNGYEDNTIRPEDNLTRAEMTAIITRAFGAKTVADISAYTDVATDAWYYDSVAKAVQMGAVNGVSATEMNPDASITREEVFTILARVLVLSSENAQVLDKFHDASAVSSWAKPYVIALTERGYVNGDERGYANPQANITREEFAQLMHNAIRTYITKSGTYKNDIEGIAVVRVGDVELKSLTVSGDLVIGDGVGTDSFKLTDVTVNGRLLARGGTNTLKKTSVRDGVVVNNMNGITAFKNYRTEEVFKGIIENTEATFLTPAAGGGGGGGGGGGVGPGPGPGPGPTSYSVSFKLPDGTLVGSPISIPTGTAIGAANMPADPTPGVGYDSFLGWFDGTTQITGATIVNGPINAVAKFNPITYAINYVYPATVTLDGSQPLSYTIENYTDPQHALPGGAEMTLPQGEVFVGWDDDGDNTTDPITALQASHIPPTADGDGNDNQLTLTLVTKQVPTWTITFDAKDASGNSLPGYPKTPQVERGQPIGAGNMPHLDPQLAGYTFVRWEDGSGNPVTAATIPPSDMTVTAKFNLNTYTISFKDAGSLYQIENFTNDRDFTVEDATAYVLPTAEQVKRAGYTFTGWTYNGTPMTQITASDIAIDTPLTIELVPSFSENTYTVDFGTAEQYIQNFTNERTFTISTLPYTLPTAAQVKKAGYTFTGWKNASNAVVTQIIASDITVDTPSTISLTADFALNTYTISFGDAEQYIQNFTNDRDFTVEDASAYVLPTATQMNRVGYTFTGWTYDGAPITQIAASNIAVDTPLTLQLTAKFSPTTYTINYVYPNNVTLDGSEPLSYTIENYTDPQHVLPGSTAMTLPQGMVFVGWDDDGDNTTDPITALQARHIPPTADGDNNDTQLTLTLVMESAPTWTITFDAKDANGNSLPGYPRPVQVTRGQSIGAANMPQDPQRAGYTFNGWEAANGVSVDANYTPTSNMTVTAKFGLKTYTISFGEAEQYIQNFPSNRTFTIESLPYTLPTAAQVNRVGYDFTGWSLNGNAVTQIAASDITASTPDTIVLTASFSLNTYTIDFGEAEQYIQNFTDDREFTVEDAPFILPTAEQVRKAGYTFTGWKNANNAVVTQIAASDITVDTPLTIVLTAEFSLNTYTIDFGEAEQYIQNFTDDRDFTVEDEPYVLPTAEQVQRAGYTFTEWTYNGNAITQIAASDITVDTPLTIVLTAEFSLNTYTIDFGEAEQYIQNFTDDREFTVEDAPFVLPTAEQVQNAGYTFTEWTYNGNAITQIAASDITVDTPDTIVLTAGFEMITYTIEYVGEGTEFTFKTGYQAPRSYDVTNYTSIVLPAEENVVLPDNKSFLGWMDGTTAITALTAAHLTAYPNTTLRLSLNNENLFKVTFFEGYNQTYQVGDTIYVPTLNAGLGDSIPVIPSYIQRRGYIKGPEDDDRADIAISSIYPNREIHTIRPTYWYEVTKEVDDGNGGTKLVTSLESFTEKTPIIADTNVYILYQKVNLNIKIGSGANEELSISASYKAAGTADDAYMTDKDTRIVDAAKDFGLSARNQFELAMDNGWLPSQFDTAQEKVFGKLEALNILDANKMIKVLDIPIPISTLVKREKADDMVKQFVRDAITTPDKLDSLLDSMDIQSFIDQIGTDDLLDMLSNAQIANALTDINNRETIVSFIMDDLKSENPTLLTPLKNYILGNQNALNELAVQLKTQLAADTPAGKSLRRMVLTSSELESVLKQDAVKTSVIDKITGLEADDAILDILLNNEQVRHDLLDEAVKDDDFVSALAKAQQFKDYAGSMLRQDLDVQAAVLDALDTDLLSELRGNASFKAQFEMGAALRTELENTIGLNTYVSDTDDLIEYLFGKPSIKTYTFINGEDVFRTIYDEENGQGTYDALTEDDKNLWKKEAYDELVFDLTTLKQDFIDELEKQFVSYFAEILDALATGSAISDADMMDLIDTEIKSYIRSYINDPLTLSVNVKNAIEDALVSYICDLLHQEDATITDANLRDIRRLILEKAYKNDQITDFIREFVKTDSHAETLIDHAYDVLDHDFVEIVHGMAEDSPEYATVEGLLKSISANIDAASLTDIIASNGENTAVIDLVKDYVKDPTYTTTIQGHVEGFIANDVDEVFVAEYRDDIINALKNVDISSMIDKDMIKSHINGLPTKDEKIAFADKIYNALANSSDYAIFMDSLFGKKTFTITKSNLPLIQAMADALGELEYDKVMAETNNAMLNKVIDTLGDAFLKDYFNAMRDGYADGLDAAIETVKNGGEGTTEEYTTSLTLSVNLIGDILKPLYDKAQVEVDEKLRKLPIRYDQNQYAQYLVQHDMISKLFSGDGVETEDHSGYGIKEILDYYDYIMELFVVADDAICWYGDDNNVTQEEFDSIYDAVFGKVQLVQNKINSILETYNESGELPDKIKAVFDRVQQLNSVITRFDPQIHAMLDKYLGSSISQAGEALGENEQIRTFVDWMFGQEDPVFTIDGLYDIFYRFDAKMQVGLQKLIDSGKLRAAIDKFEETSIGSLFKGKGTIENVAEKIDAIKNGEKVTESLNSIYELMEIVAATGIDAFRVNTGVVTDKDVYRFSIGPIVFTMTRQYE